MKIAATADLHGYLPEVPPCDVLVIAGDWTPVTNHKLAYQMEWADTEFRYWLNEVPAQHIIGIAGNHDFVARKKESFIRSLPWTYLKDESVTIAGVKFHGAPYVPPFGSWAFMIPEDELTEKWKLIDPDTNILIAHGPPYGYGDRSEAWLLARGLAPANVGSRTLREKLDELSLDLLVCGHIHEAGGSYDYNGLPIWNVSYVDFSYRPRNYIPTFNLTGKEGGEAR